MNRGDIFRIDVHGERLQAWSERVDYLLDVIARRRAAASSPEVQLGEYLRCHRHWAQLKLDKMRRCQPHERCECEEEMESALSSIDHVWRALARRLEVA